MKTLSLLKSIIFILAFFNSIEVFCQTNTITSGNWNTPGTWSTGVVPGNGTNTNVNHELTLNIDLSPSATYTINAPVTDPDGGSNYNLDVSGTLDINANMKAGGTLQVSGNVIVRSGDTLTIGYPGSTGSSNINIGGTLTIEAGGVLVVNGDLATQFLGIINCDGKIIIDGNFDAGLLSGVAGNGTIDATGTITTGFLGSVYGSGSDCNTGPCSASSTCGVGSGNTITLGFTIPSCTGAAPGVINGNNLTGSTYKWQSSTTSATTGFSDIASATGQNYSPAALTTQTWFRRIATGGCSPSTSTAVLVTIASPSTVSVSITSTTTAVCAGVTSVTFTATPVNGGAAPSYQWKKNGSNVGTNSATFTTTALASGNIITCVMTSNASCITGSPTTSNAITLTSLTNPVSVSITSSATSFCSGASITFAATPINGGSSPSYQWKKNGGNVGTNSSTYTTTGLANNDVITCVMTSNASCVSGNPATSNGITVSVLSSGGGTWSGGTSSNWNTNGNWCSGGRPASGTNVIISGGVLNDPVVSSAAAVCNNLTLNSGAVLTINGNTLSAGGNLVINSGATMEIKNSTATITGSITINSGGTLIITSPGALSAKGNIINNGEMSGTGITTLNGPAAQTLSGNGSYENLTLNNALGCTATSNATISGTLTLTTGQLTSNGNVTIDLNTGGIAGTGTGTISGNITTMKTVGSGKYHYIAAPLSGLQATDWNDDVQIKSGSYSNLYTYDETNTDTSKVVGWTAQTSLTTPLTSLTGFALYFPGNTSLDQTGPYTHSASYTSPALTNTVSNYLGTPNPASDGWNLVGNPYPSTIDWSSASGWTKTGLDNAIYFWDPVNDRYATYVTGIGTNGGTRYISSMQAFWVKVTNPGTGSLAMNNNVRVTSTYPAIWRTAAITDILKLTVNSVSYSDETIIRFRDDAQDNFDSELDAYKMNNEGNTPSLYTELNKDQYSINSLPYASKTNLIPVKLIANFAGTYTITAEEIGSFSGDSIVFEDRLLGVKQDLRTSPSYTCSMAAGDTSGRFYISFRQGNVNGLNLSPPISPSIIIRGIEDNINIRFLNDNSTKATIVIYSTLGEQVLKVENADISSKDYALKLSTIRNGIYIVKIMTDTQTCSKKVYLSK